ncbi:hypothetical protein [Jeotgalibacillus marinus]|uniref:Uncharacterized protein n=1 Tax=Jeotgalibacillus marinus TaxID=86667 RepID=A0ABV3Q7L0_9BACL
MYYEILLALGVPAVIGLIILVVKNKNESRKVSYNQKLDMVTEKQRKVKIGFF